MLSEEFSHHAVVLWSSTQDMYQKQIVPFLAETWSDLESTISIFFRKETYLGIIKALGHLLYPAVERVLGLAERMDPVLEELSGYWSQIATVFGRRYALFLELTSILDRQFSEWTQELLALVDAPTLFAGGMIAIGFVAGLVELQLLQ